MKNSFIAAVSLIGVLGLAADAQAEERATALRSVTACRAIAEAGARLACFDRAVAALDEAEKSGDIVVADRAQVARTKRSLFGFSLPRLGLFRNDDKEEPAPEQIEARIASVRGLAYDRFEIRLEDGAVWRTLEPARVPPVTGGTAKIRKAALGSYLISFNGARSVRGTRVG